MATLVWSAPFRLRLPPFGSVSGLFSVLGGVGVVGERGFCKGKEYHHSSSRNLPFETLGLSNSFPYNLFDGGYVFSL